MDKLTSGIALNYTAFGSHIGGHIGGQLLNHLCYADDMCLTNILVSLRQACNSYSMFVILFLLGTRYV